MRGDHQLTMESPKSLENSPSPVYDGYNDDQLDAMFVMEYIASEAEYSDSTEAEDNKVFQNLLAKNIKLGLHDRWLITRYGSLDAGRIVILTLYPLPYQTNKA